MATWLAMASLGSSACFVGYNSNWGEGERSQKAVAAKATPQEIQATETSQSAVKLRVLHMRAFVSDRYSAEVGDEERKIGEIIDNVNQVLEPTLDAQLELVEVKRWKVDNDDDLESLLIRLAGEDPADDVQWVVGFAGKPATLQESFRQLGLARSPGKYFVVRAMNSAAEYDFVQKGFGELDESERRDIYKKRLEHKETSIFLHELAHSLGAVHTRKRATIMHAMYDIKATRFSAPVAQLMRMSLDHRIDPSAMSDAQNAKELSELLEATPSHWVEQDRRVMLDLLRGQAQPAQAPAMPSGFDQARWRTMSAEEQKRYHEALQLEAAGRAHDALEMATPLFESHRDGHEVQDLRCRLAMRIGGNRAAIEQHCKPFEDLQNQPKP